MPSEQPVQYKVNVGRFVLGVAKEHLPRHPRRVVLGSVLKVIRWRLQGDVVECPACGATASQFFSGVVYSGTFCPSCGASSRARLQALFLRRELKIEQSAARVLHFAPEPGLINMLSSLPTVDYMPADLVPDKDHERIDATAIHLDPSFTGVITSHVLEHIPDDIGAISEMQRILVPGGWALVLVPVHAELELTFEDASIRSRWQRERYFGQHDHVRIYGRDFRMRLQAAGFDVHERRYASELSEAEVMRYGLSDRDVIYLCIKPAVDWDAFAAGE
jgi:SAM-dependent methyltransferase